MGVSRRNSNQIQKSSASILQEQDRTGRRTSPCAPSTSPFCDWYRALQRFSLNSGISAIRSKLLINEGGTKLLTNDSRELGQQWKKKIETSPSLLFLVFWGCWHQSPGTGGVGDLTGQDLVLTLPNTGSRTIKHRWEEQGLKKHECKGHFRTSF